MRRSLAVGALAAAVIGAGASPAWAGTEEGSGGGEWVPVEQLVPGYYATTETSACGTTVTVAAGDVREVEARETVLPDGTVVTDFRGALTLDLTRQSDGAMIDELDVSGPGHQVVAPDGASGDVTFEGPSLLFPYPGEEHFFTEAGLPDLAYFRHGEVTLHIALDLATGETTSLTVDVHARILDVCRWFDHGGGHGDWR